MKGKLAENSPRNPFVSETGNPSEDQKVKMKSKENQVLLLESMLAATRSQLAECKDQNAELQRKEFENVEKISVLQFELHSKSAELGTMGLVIRRLNEKIKSVNQRTPLNTEEQRRRRPLTLSTCQVSELRGECSTVQLGKSSRLETPPSSSYRKPPRQPRSCNLGTSARSRLMPRIVLLF